MCFQVTLGQVYIWAKITGQIDPEAPFKPLDRVILSHRNTEAQSLGNSMQAVPPTRFTSTVSVYLCIVRVRKGWQPGLYALYTVSASCGCTSRLAFDNIILN